MVSMTVSEIANANMGAKNLLKVLAKRNADSNVDTDEAINSIKSMSKDEAEGSVFELIKAYAPKGRDHQPKLGYWWFGIADDVDEDYEGGRRRRRRRSRRKSKRKSTKKRRRKRRKSTKKKRRRRRRK